MALSGEVKRQNLPFRVLVTVANLSVAVSAPDTINVPELRPCFSSVFLTDGSVRKTLYTIAEGFCESLQSSAKESVRGIEIYSTKYQPVDKKIYTIEEEMDTVSAKGVDKQEEDENDPYFYNDIVHEKWKINSGEFLSFPLDPVAENYVRRNVPNAIFSVVEPTPLKGQTMLVGVSSAALELIDLLPSVATSSYFCDFASGAWRHPSSTPLAHRYGGYQFGWWAQQLGDGRAHLLGHYTNRCVLFKTFMLVCYTLVNGYLL